MQLDRRQFMVGLAGALGSAPGVARAAQPPPGPDQPPQPNRAEAPAMVMPSAERRVVDPVQPGAPLMLVKALILSQSYAGLPRLALPNAARDGRLVAERFRQLRFDGVATIGDGTAADTLAALSAFLAGIDRSTIAIIYLAGHGIELAGENLFMLGDGRTFVSLQTMVQALQACAGVTVLFLDACRNNPYAAGLPPARIARTVAAAQGPAQLDILSLDAVRRSVVPATARLRAFSLAGSGVKIVFSTDPGNVAYDGAYDSSRNSPFAAALARRLRQPVSLDDVIALTTGDVIAATQRRQAPWSQGSLERPIYLSARRIRQQQPQARTGSLFSG